MRPVSHETTNRKPSAASSMRCFSSCEYMASSKPVNNSRRSLRFVTRKPHRIQPTCTSYSYTLSTGLCPGCVYLISEEGRFVGAISVGVATSSQRLHVRHSHSQDGQLVRFPRQRTAGGNHVGQLCDVGGHLVPPPPLDFAMIFPEGQKARWGGKEESRWGKKQTGRWTTWRRVKS